MIKNVPKDIINHPQQVVLRNVNDIFRDYEKIIKSKISFEVVKVNVGYPLFKQHTMQEEIRKLNEETLNKKRNLFTNWLTQRRHSNYFELQEEKRTEIYESFYDFITNVYLKSDIQNVQLQDKSTIFVTLRFSKAIEMIEKLNRQKSKIWDICTEERDEKLLFPIPDVVITKAP